MKWTPSRLIKRLGEAINNEDSIYYWAAKNDIPVYSPAVTDGSIGDMIFFFSYKNEGFVLDLVQDCIEIDLLETIQNFVIYFLQPRLIFYSYLGTV